MDNRHIPEFKGNLRSHMIEMPICIREANGILIFGKRIKSIVFTTDVAIIRNTNADAVIAVYPFTPQPIITHAIMQAADTPVFCGVGGGITMGKRVVTLAQDAEFQGALGVVVNAPTSNETIHAMKDVIDIPIVLTVVSLTEDFKVRIEAGVNIFNVSGAHNTVDIIKKIKHECPGVPIIATGGPTDDTILETITAGANAISYTPPTTAAIFTEIMNNYRNN